MWRRNRRYPIHNPTLAPTYPVELIPDHPLANGLIGYYLLQGDVRDYSPYGLNGTTVNNPPLAASPIGPAMSFAGTASQQSASAPVISSLNTSSNISMGAWITIVSGGGFVLSLGKSGCGILFNCVTGTSSTVQAFAGLGSSVSASGGGGSPTLVLGGTYHFFATWNHTAGTIIYYLNGVQMGSGTFGGSTTLWNVAGGIFFGTMTTTSQQWGGARITGATLYNRTLAPGEVLQVATETFDMLQPVTKRAYYTPGLITPDDLAINAVTKQPVASFSLLESGFVNVNATAPKPNATVHLFKGESASIRATTQVPHAAFSLTQASAASINTTTRSPVAKIGLFTGDAASVNATAPRPSATIDATISTRATISVTTQSPHAAFSLKQDTVVALSAKTALPHASISLTQETVGSISAKTASPVAKINLLSGTNASINAVVPKPSASFDATAKTIVTLSATTQSPHAAATMFESAILTIGAKTASPAAHVSLETTTGVSIAATTVLPNAHFVMGETIKLAVLVTTRPPGAHFNAEKGESLSIAATLPFPPASAIAVVKQGERLSIDATTKQPVAQIIVGQGKVATISVTTRPPTANFVLEQHVVPGVANAPRPIADIQLVVGESLSIVAVAPLPSSRASIDTTTEMTIAATTPMPSALANASTLSVASRSFYGLAVMPSFRAKAFLNNNSGLPHSVATVLEGPTNFGLLNSTGARVIKGHPIMVYKIPQIIQLVYPASTNYQGYFMENYPLNRTDFRLVRGIQNEINFYVRDVDRKPVSLGNTETLTINIVEPATDTLLMSRNMTTVDPTQGIYLLTIYPNEMNTWPTESLTWSVAYNREDGSTVLLWTDRIYSPFSTCVVTKAPVPPPSPTISQASTTFILNGDNNYYSQALPGTAQGGGPIGNIQTFFFQFNDYTGSLRFDASNAIAPINNSSSSDWFEIDVQTYTNQTGGVALNETGNYQWLRAVMITPFTGSFSMEYKK